jgi:3-deoxy-manno-octulosonate cytidylyltransferase (CMP-KDO synthetase)
MTRAAVPVFRKKIEVPVYRQTGIIAFRKKALNDFSALPETALEIAESVDMLRAIEHGMRIAGVLAAYPTVGVDHPSDVAIVEKFLQEDPLQKSLLEKTRMNRHE